MAHDERPPDQPAEAEAEDVGLLDPEVGEEGGDVVGQLVDRHRSVGVGRASVTLQFDGDHLAARRQRGEHRAEHEVDREHPAVEQHERSPASVDLVVQPQPVDVGEGTRGIIHAG